MVKFKNHTVKRLIKVIIKKGLTKNQNSLLCASSSKGQPNGLF